jgi:hypothetical protein
VKPALIVTINEALPYIALVMQPGREVRLSPLKPLG